MEIFEFLPILHTAGCHIWWPLTGVYPRFFYKYFDFFQTIHTGGRHQWYLQDATSFVI